MEDSSPAMEEEGSEEENSDGDEIENRNRQRSYATGRGITLGMLLSDGILETGQGCLSIEYLGKKFVADLLPSGKIQWQETNQVFNSPSAWAIHCKKIVNPSKKSGCGWASVKYKGRKLDTFKSTWFRKHNKFSQGNLHEAIPNGAGNNNSDPTNNNTLAENLNGASIDPSNQDDVHTDTEGPQDLSVSKKQKDIPQLIQKVPPLTGVVFSKKSEERRISHSYLSLGSRSPEHDCNMLVMCTPFSALGKSQPFTVSVSTNCLLLVDFHCHLTTSEVVGYLAGTWDHNLRHLNIKQAYPCRCRLGDKDNALIVEEEIRQNMERRSLWLVGWYHSHPTCQPDPTLKDIDCQMDYQVRLKGFGNHTTHHPCLGFICSPFGPNNIGKDSSFQAYWVLPPPETRPKDYGIPMHIEFSSVQEMHLSQDLLNEMKWLSDYYHNAPDKIGFHFVWQTPCTYLDKLKASVSKKLPQDQTDGSFVEFIQRLLF